MFTKKVLKIFKSYSNMKRMKLIIIALLSIIALILTTGSIVLSNNIVTNSQINAARNVKNSLSKELEYYFALIPIQADSFTNSNNIKNFFINYNILDDFDKYSIENSIQTYINSIAETSKIITSLAYIPQNKNITVQTRGLCPYNNDIIKEKRDIVDKIETDGWGIMPIGIEKELDVPKEQLGTNLSYFKKIKDKTKNGNDTLLIINISYDKIAEYLNNKNNNKNIALVFNNKIIYKGEKIKDIKQKLISNSESYRYEGNKFIYTSMLTNLPISLYFETNIVSNKIQYIPFIFSLIILIILYKFIDKLINNILGEINLINKHICNEEINKNKIVYLNDMLSSADSLSKIKEETESKNKEITLSIKEAINNTQLAVNNIMQSIQQIQNNLRDSLSQWLSFRRSYFALDTNINYLNEMKYQFNKNINNNNQRIIDDMIKTKDETQNILEKLEDIQHRQKFINKQYLYLNESLNGIKDLKKIRSDIFPTIEQLDLISINTIIKTAKDESNTTLNIISYSIVENTKIIKQNIEAINLTIDKLIENIKDDTSENYNEEKENIYYDYNSSISAIQLKSKMVDTLSNQVGEICSSITNIYRDNAHVIDEVIQKQNLLIQLNEDYKKLLANMQITAEQMLDKLNYIEKYWSEK
ncbi:hypothetical protein ACAG39_07730 [Caldicellulosiruptoraceae bacterium PP1]